ncbi:MAG TPA: NAD(+) kinase [Firmicutes bacterium]|nr:NAD(+) kinase [Bacillota bacterium]
MKIENVALIVNKEKAPAYEMGRFIVTYCEKHGLKAWLLPVDAAFLGLPNRAASLNELRERADLVLSLGGDGTLLGAARLFAEAGVPVLGINLGRLGFLTAVEPDRLETALSDIVAGRGSIDERTLLKATIWRRGQRVEESLALNDVVITKGAFARIIAVSCYIDGEYLTTYPGDGIIVATATGSTAYSLSAGGPIINPTLDCLILTPICPHTLSARSIVISAQETLRVTVSSDHGDIMLTVDGQKGYPLEPDDSVTVTKAPCRAKLIRLPDQSFYRILRTRLQDTPIVVVEGPEPHTRDS